MRANTCYTFIAAKCLSELMDNNTVEFNYPVYDMLIKRNGDSFDIYSIKNKIITCREIESVEALQSLNVDGITAIHTKNGFCIKMYRSINGTYVENVWNLDTNDIM